MITEAQKRMIDQNGMIKNHAGQLLYLENPWITGDKGEVKAYGYDENDTYIRVTWLIPKKSWEDKNYCANNAISYIEFFDENSHLIKKGAIK